MPTCSHDHGAHPRHRTTQPWMARPRLEGRDDEIALNDHLQKLSKQYEKIEKKGVEGQGTMDLLRQEEEVAEYKRAKRQGPMGRKRAHIPGRKRWDDEDEDFGYDDDDEDADTITSRGKRKWVKNKEKRRKRERDTGPWNGKLYEDVLAEGFETRYVPLGSVDDAVLDDVLEVLQVEPSELIVDLGCGDGKILRRAAEKFGCRGWGVDYEEDLVIDARKSLSEEMRSRVSVAHGNFMDPKLWTKLHKMKPAVYMFYLAPTVYTLLGMKLAPELKRGATVCIMHGQMPGWEKFEVRKSSGYSAKTDWRIYQYNGDPDEFEPPEIVEVDELGNIVDDKLTKRKKLDNVQLKGERVTVTFQPGSPVGVSAYLGLVGDVIEGGQAEEQGVRPGWSLIAINNQTCRDFKSEEFASAASGPRPYKATFLKAEEVTFTFQPGTVGVDDENGLVLWVAEGYQAYDLGLKEGMKLIAINGEKCYDFEDQAFADAAGGETPYEATFVKVA